MSESESDDSQTTDREQTAEPTIRNGDVLDQRYQIAGKLRLLADIVEQEGRAIDDSRADLHVEDNHATVVAEFDLEAPVSKRGGV